MDKTEEILTLDKEIKTGGISEEQLSKELSEQSIVAAEILKDQKEEKERAIISNPSSLALETSPKEAGEGNRTHAQEVGALRIVGAGCYDSVRRLKRFQETA